MFVLKEESTFDWNAKAMVPIDGKRKAVQFMARFNILDMDRQDELLGNPETRDVKQFLEAALVKFWDLNVQDAQGNEIEDDSERNAIISKNPIFIEALTDAYGIGVLNYKPKN